MMGTIMLGLIIILISLGVIVMFIELITNLISPTKDINIMHISISKMATNKYSEPALLYIMDTLRDLDIQLIYDYDDCMNHITKIDINHTEYGVLYQYRKRNQIKEVYKEYIKIYKDINDIFNEASNITTNDDANKAKDRLEQMANYHRDTYQISKKMNT